jgi:hypothetical protein
MPDWLLTAARMLRPPSAGSRSRTPHGTGGHGYVLAGCCREPVWSFVGPDAAAVAEFRVGVHPIARPRVLRWPRTGRPHLADVGHVLPEPLPLSDGASVVTIGTPASPKPPEAGQVFVPSWHDLTGGPPQLDDVNTTVAGNSAIRPHDGADDLAALVPSSPCSGGSEG